MFFVIFAQTPALLILRTRTKSAEARRQHLLPDWPSPHSCLARVREFDPFDLIRVIAMLGFGLSPDKLARFFHLSGDDQALTLSDEEITTGWSSPLQLTTVRFLGTFWKIR